MTPSLILVLVFIAPSILAVHNTLTVNFTTAGCKELLDVVVVVDSSDSITNDSFNLIKSSLEELVAYLHIGQDETRLGIILYSSDITAKIPFSNNTQFLIDAIANLEHARDGTNTAVAIEEAIFMFQQDGREGVPKVAVVITDGISKNTSAVIEQAAIAKEEQIDMFAVGISNKVNMEELQGIASKENQVLTAESFDSLQGLLHKVVLWSCPPPTCPLEIIAVVDGSDSISTDDFSKLIQALSNLVEEVNVKPGHTRFGIILYSSTVTKVISLSNNKTYLLEEVANLEHPRDGTETAAALSEMYLTFLNESLPGVPKIGIVITDGISKNSTATAEQAELVKTDLGVNMFAVGISNMSDISELSAIASAESNILAIDFFDDLQQILENIVVMFCPPRPVCAVALDVIAVVDGSDSITAPEFRALKESLIDLISEFDIGNEYSDARFGVILYSSNITAVIELSNNVTFLVQAIEALDHPREGTETALALQKMLEMFSLKARTFRQQVGIVITDGISKNPALTISYAEEARKRGITMFAVAVSTPQIETELTAISSDGHVFKADDFFQLNDSLAEIVENICNGSGNGSSQGDNWNGNPVVTTPNSQYVDDNPTETTTNVVVITPTSTKSGNIAPDSSTTTRAPCGSDHTSQPSTSTTIRSSQLNGGSSTLSSSSSSSQSGSTKSTITDSNNLSSTVTITTLSNNWSSTTKPTDSSSSSSTSTPNNWSSTTSKNSSPNNWSSTSSTKSSSDNWSSTVSSPNNWSSSSSTNSTPNNWSSTSTTKSSSNNWSSTTSTISSSGDRSSTSTRSSVSNMESSTPSSSSTTPSNWSPKTTTPTKQTGTNVQPVTQGPTIDPSECDGCKILNGIGFKEYSPNCHQFIQCSESADGKLAGLVLTCPIGLYWSQDLLTCMYPKLATCRKDPCFGIDSGIQFPIAGDCRHYYSCDYQTSIRKCCPTGTAFDSDKRICVAGTSCNVPCSLVQPPVQPQPIACELKETVGDPNSYQQLDGDQWVTRTCPAGTTFNIVDCKCSNLIPVIPPKVLPIQPVGCQTLLYLPFDEDTNDKSGFGTYVNNDGVTVDKATGYAYFDGKRGLRIPRFSNMDFAGRTLLIEIKYMHDGIPSNPQSLVTNADCGAVGPLQMVASNGEITFSFNSGNDVTKVEQLPRGGNEWIEASFQYENGLLKGAAGPNPSTSSENSIFVSEPIIRSPYALQIGRGDKFDFFRGWMDYVKVTMC